MSISVFVRTDGKYDKIYKLILSKNNLIKQWGRRTQLELREKIISYDLQAEAQIVYEKECLKRIKRNYSEAPKAMCWYQGKLFQ
ncbi:hypothetical protein MJH12_10555 [bacterium]|nr:hypothetical protein [bacterium]